MPNYSISKEVQAIIAGCTSEGLVGFDEVGRGPLAGPVLAACAILPQHFALSGITDSKVLSETKREKLFPELCAKTFWGIGWLWPEDIERLNIHYASLEAMRLAWHDLEHRFPQAASMVRYGISDGKYCPSIPFPCQHQVKGDLLIPAISVASIIAKVTRDRYMEEQDLIFPGYGFAKHKGYPTLAHRQSLEKLGPCPIHRLSWVSKILLSSSSEKVPPSATLS